LAQTDDTGSNVALKKGDHPQFTLRAVRPAGVAKFVGQHLSLPPRLSGERRIQVFVGLAFDD